MTNRAASEAGLRARGSLTVWFSDEAIEGWRAEARTDRGGQPRYSALAITTALTLRAVFRLALRQHEFGAAQRAGIAEQQQGAVAQVGQAPGAAGGDQRLDLGGGERRGAAGRPCARWMPQRV